jgi:hypothetical protein
LLAPLLAAGFVTGLAVFFGRLFFAFFAAGLAWRADAAFAPFFFTGFLAGFAAAFFADFLPGFFPPFFAGAIVRVPPSSQPIDADHEGTI